MNKLMREDLGKAIEWPIGFFLPAIFRSFVLIIAWGWFVTPTFGFRPPGIVAMIGLMGMLRFIFRPRKFKEKTPQSELDPEEQKVLKKKFEKWFWEVFWFQISDCLTFLIACWIIHLFL